MDYEAAVREFMGKHGQELPSNPTLRDWKLRDLRRRLLTEEGAETIAGLLTEDLEEIADGLADLLYVTFGTAIALGIPISEIFAEVHRSNMTKDVKAIDEKVQKGANYSPPNLKPLLGLS